MKLDVFWCTAAASERRATIAAATKDWWRDWCQANRADFIELNPSIAQCGAIEFNRTRRIIADQEARDSLYILTDDDCIPVSGDSVPAGLETLGRMGEGQFRFGILSAYPQNCTIHPWTPGEEVVVCFCGRLSMCPACNGRGHYKTSRTVYEDLQVMEHVSVGGLRFCRKGVIERWPPRDPDAAGYDMIQADYLRSLDWRVGYLQHVRAIHYGEGHSDLQDQWHRHMEEHQ